jgi:hypothetical protein
MEELVDVTMIDEQIDQWEVTFKYPDEKLVTLHVQHHLVQPLPPKMTVVFPSSISYVCFEELGTASWTPTSDLVALFLALHNEYRDRCQKLTDGSKQEREQAQKQWEFVQGAHTDWKIVDIAKLTEQLDKNAVDTLRNIGGTLLKDSTELLKKSTELLPEGLNLSLGQLKKTSEINKSGKFPFIEQRPIENIGLGVSLEYPLGGLFGDDEADEVPLFVNDPFAGHAPRQPQPARPRVKEVAASIDSPFVGLFDSAGIPNKPNPQNFEKICQACNRRTPRADFSLAQWKKAQPKCKACVAQEEMVPQKPRKK